MALKTERTQRFKRVYQFLLERERTGATFTVGELTAASEWKPASAKTNLSKKLKSLVERVRPGVFRPLAISTFTEDEFVRLMSQNQAVSADPKKPNVTAEVEALLIKARESALLALQVYNNPTSSFKTEAFSVLMIIAWTSLMHAIFERRGKDYFYKDGDGKPKIVDGDKKAWELGECLTAHYGGVNSGVRANLDFFIRLRNRVEHRYVPKLDAHVAGECQALLLNFDDLLTSEFGSYWAIRESLAVPLQTSTIRPAPQAKALRALQARYLAEVVEFVDAFRAQQSDATLADPHFSFRVYLVPKIGNHKSSDAAIEFVPYDPANPDAFRDIQKSVTMIRERRVPVAHANFLPKDVVKAVKERLGRPFTIDTHTRAWRKYQVRPSGKFAEKGCDERYCLPDPAHEDFLYTQAWIDLLVNRLADDAEYKAVCTYGKSDAGAR